MKCDIEKRAETGVDAICWLQLSEECFMWVVWACVQWMRADVVPNFVCNLQALSLAQLLLYLATRVASSSSSMA